MQGIDISHHSDKGSSANPTSPPLRRDEALPKWNSSSQTPSFFANTLHCKIARKSLLSGKSTNYRRTKPSHKNLTALVSPPTERWPITAVPNVALVSLEVVKLVEAVVRYVPSDLRLLNS